MPRNVGGPARADKSRAVRKRNQNVQNRNQISAAMQKTRDLLPKVKAAEHLEILAGIDRSRGRKLLGGFIRETLEDMNSILRSPLGREVFLAWQQDNREGWLTRYRKQLDIDAARRHLNEASRQIEALQLEASQ